MNSAEDQEKRGRRCEFGPDGRMDRWTAFQFPLLVIHTQATLHPETFVLHTFLCRLKPRSPGVAPGESLITLPLPRKRPVRQGMRSIAGKIGISRVRNWRTVTTDKGSCLPKFQTPLRPTSGDSVVGGRQRGDALRLHERGYLRHKGT